MMMAARVDVNPPDQVLGKDVACLHISRLVSGVYEKV
jgi:hypothetical protein